MDKPAEILVFDFLTEKLEAAPPDTVLFDLQLHDTVWQRISEIPGRGVRISDAVGDLSPGPGGTSPGDWKEYDVFLTIACFSRVKGQEQTQRQPALIDVFQIEQAIYILLWENPTLSGRICDLLLKKCSRGYDNLGGNPYAVVNIPLIINPSGARYTE